jgi:hypothetical protein
MGCLARHARGNGNVALLVLAGAPFLLLFLQSYGGEVFLRIYALALPFMIVLVAAFILPSWPPRHVLATGMLACVVTVGLTRVFFLARYGNENFGRHPTTTPEAREASTHVDQLSRWRGHRNFRNPERPRIPDARHIREVQRVRDEFTALLQRLSLSSDQQAQANVATEREEPIERLIEDFAGTSDVRHVAWRARYLRRIGSRRAHRMQQAGYDNRTRAFRSLGRPARGMVWTCAVSTAGGRRAHGGMRRRAAPLTTTPRLVLLTRRL